MNNGDGRRRCAQIERCYFFLVMMNLAMCAQPLLSDEPFLSGQHPSRLGRVCEAYMEEVGPWLPRRLRCPCAETTVSDAKSSFKASSGLYILPDLDEQSCSGYEETLECVPAQSEVPGIKPCELGGLDVVLPDTASPQSPVAEESRREQDYHELVMEYVLDSYRNYTCQYGGDDAAHCSDHPRKRVQASVLDFGADPSGQQLQYLSTQVDGNVAGYNVKDGNYRPALFKFQHPGNFTFVWGHPGGCLPFPDASFDFVYAINVMEHASPLEKVMSEILRVLKPGGLFAARWFPNFFSAKGHHLHPDMIEYFQKKYGDEGNPACYDIEYKNDGSMVPDWAHLYMEPNEYRKALMRSEQLASCPQLVEYMVQFALLDKDLSRVNVWQILQFFESTGAADIVRLSFDPSVGHGETLHYHQAKKIADKYGSSDVLLGGSEIWIRRRDGPMPPADLPHSLRHVIESPTLPKASILKHKKSV